MRLFDANGLSEEDFGEILSFLRTGGVIGFPTDTAYGLGADPFNEAAVRRIFEIKGRPENKPILLLVNSMAMAERVSVFSTTARMLGERFWPGPLTLILPARECLPDTVTAGSGTIGVRWGKAPFAERLISALGTPLTATSANLSGQASAVTVEELRAQLEDRLDVVVYGGRLPERGGSTLVDLTTPAPRILREGPISEAVMEAISIGEVK
jgi:L-threonylcarbamoyladenylate synthase